MTQMSAPLLSKLKESIADPDAAWVMQSAMITKRTEQTITGSGVTLTTITSIVNNDSYRIASTPLNLQLVFLAEYTPDAVRSLSVTFQGITLTTTDQDLLAALQAMAGTVSSNQDAALLQALTLPTS